jgi:hypothetical protein
MTEWVLDAAVLVLVLAVVAVGVAWAAVMLLT